jgi:hypothetical protein
MACSFTLFKKIKMWVMKTILFIAFIGLSTIDGYAQSKCKCPCKHKTLAHKTAVVHHDMAPDKNKEPYLPPYILVLPHVPNTYVPAPPAPEPCYTYTQHNIVVQECPATIYGGNDAIQFNREGTFLGYYPDKESDNGSKYENPVMAPQHTVISNYRGEAPADGNSCSNCQSQ